MRLLLFFAVMLLVVVPSMAQKKVKIEKANTLTGGVDAKNERFQRLVGNVVLKQNTTTIYCDSAVFYKAKNTVDAFGHIHITEGDSVDCTSLELSYEGDKKLAHLRKKVVFKKLNTMTLYTDYLDFDRIKNTARYFNGGKLVDTANTLTSKKGYYDLKTNLASFKRDVVGVTPDYTMTSDTLQYNSKTKVVYFKKETIVKDREGGTAVYQNGYYDTKKKISNLNKGNIETPDYKLVGDVYFLDDVKKFYKARGHVVMTSKEENMLIYGDVGDVDKLKGITKVYGHSYVAKVTDEMDTLFIRADTLVSIENDDPRKKRLLAYHDVRIFKKDLQGRADSMAYIASDSTLHLYRDPVLWTDANQMTGDSIRLLIKQKKIDRIYLVSNSFVVSQDSLKNFNQIKGRKMTAYFDGKAINHVIVQGNGESVYFALQETEIKNDSIQAKLTVTTGMNKIICSNMKIFFKAGKLDNITFLIKPDASFIPPHELKKEDKVLKGFTWRGMDRPTRDDVMQKAVQASPNDTSCGVL